MRAALILMLAGLVTSGCSVANRTERTSGVGFDTASAAPAQSAPVQGNYRAALFNDLQN